MDYKHKNPFDPSDNELIARFSAFMTLVVTSAKTDYLRKQRKWSNEIPMNEPPESKDIPACHERWQSAVSENEFYFSEDRISDELSNLPQMRKRILEMSFIEGWSAMEIAEKLGCTVKYVYDQKHAALKKLRDRLLRGGDGDE